MTAAFDAFFARAFARDIAVCPPHPYQRAIATERDLPELVCVPTGCGKTAALVIGWLWRRFRHEDPDVRARTPRRLVYCLPMRTLVEQVRSNVIFWLKNLAVLAGETDDDHHAHYKPSWTEGRVPVFTLMGGEERVDWQAYPEREAILIGTQDMLLSRGVGIMLGAAPRVTALASRSADA